MTKPAPKLIVVVTAVSIATAIALAPRAEDPPYPHGEFVDDCLNCHSPDRWTPVPADRGRWTHPSKFPLEGAHRSAPCRGCHLSLEFSKAPSACADCHADPHRGELGIDCAVCHRPTNFLDRSTQLHSHRSTRFPLTGAHVSQDCAACHTPQPQGALTWVGLDPACSGCHLAQYQATADPDHEQAGFPTECQLCHTPTAWDRARFEHAGTGFQLTGRHRDVACSSCHANGYAGTPTDCYACHADDYAGTTNPDHEAAGFPTDCNLCHTTNGFSPASFTEHDSRYFPIFSGVHRGRWETCSDCHTQPSNFAVFNCLGCHDEADTTSEHDGVNGYSYDSAACYRCHPQGRAN
jgi:hypothetical protein